MRRRDAWLGAFVPLWMAGVTLAVSYTFASGKPPGLMRRDFDSMQMHSVRAHFGDYADTRRVFRADAPKRGYVEARAAAELFDGRPGMARRFYERAGQMEMDDPAQQPYWLNRLAVANALDDHPERALLLLGQALEAAELESELPELLVNRGVLRARAGDWAAAEGDLRAAAEAQPGLPPAWANLAVLLETRGRSAEADEARARFERSAASPPRGFPYGVGNGFLYDSGAGQRFMLMWGADDRLSLYRPPRARNRPPGSR